MKRVNEDNAREAMEEALWQFIQIAGAFPRIKPDERTWAHVLAYMPAEKRPEIIKLWSAA